jgi:TonB family protein
MKLIADNLKLTTKTKNKAANTAVFAAVLTVFFHGLVFSIPAYLIYKGAKLETRNSKPVTKNNTIFIDVSMLPAIKASGEKSVIKETAGKKSAGREPGLNGEAEKHGSPDAEKEMLTYLDMIKQKIQQARKYPADARQKGIEGKVEIIFTVLKQGGLKNVEIIRTSGNESLDEEAVATVKRASPFPAMPADFAGPEITRQVNIKFNIE